MKSLSFTAKFLTAPLECEVNGWTVEYLSFVQPNTAHKSPIIILGGAFQKFYSFKKDVEMLMGDFPIYLVDLPGQGGNQQLAPDLGFEDYADLLAGFCDKLGLDQVVPVALSYGSAIGFQFASKYPQRCEKLILGGTTPRLRDSARMLLDESIHALHKNEMKDFSAGVVLNLMNFNQRHYIPGAEVLSRGLYRNMQRIGEVDQHRYLHNTNRLLALDNLPKSPECEVLVLAGEFDNFTTPYECWQVSQLCHNSQFGIIKNTDHLAPYERKELVNKVYRRFIKGESIKRVSGLEMMVKKEFPNKKLRLEPRWAVDDSAFLESAGGVYIPVNLVNINSVGCKLYTSFEKHPSLEGENKFTLKLSTQEDLDVDVMIFHHEDKQNFRGVFKHCNFDKTKAFEGFIEKIAMSNKEVSKAAA